jgi:hypothetical protein
MEEDERGEVVGAHVHRKEVVPNEWLNLGKGGRKISNGNTTTTGRYKRETPQTIAT